MFRECYFDVDSRENSSLTKETHLISLSFQDIGVTTPEDGQIVVTKKGYNIL